MANFGPKDIKKLREMTEAGMMDCKKALSASDGDMDDAVAWLRDKGMGAAAKKAGKVAAEGSIAIKVEAKKASIIEINSQTDFVAQNDKFIGLMNTVVGHAFDNGLVDADAINNSMIDDAPFSEYLSQMTATIGEKLVVRRASLISADETTAVNAYVHSNKQNGVIIEAKCDSEKTAEAMNSVLKEVAMHAAAMSPSTLSFEDFDASFVAEETKGRIVAIQKENEELKRLGKTLKNVPAYISMSQLTEEVMTEVENTLKAELQAEGKPEKIWDRILPGKIARFISDNTTLDQEQCLLDQKFVMDDTKTVAQYIAQKAKSAGGTAEITNFVRLEVGEGIEVAEEDFAAEVAAQLG
ncbi:Translation elongation factor Ts [hydrothermal vent metagenome]|uniref:Translation elongation factor Ts n=1 Tax=hydrothermal vent metagenome TaxID=652676 RepID=A0A1W1D0P6_9ZZZZ